MTGNRFVTRSSQIAARKLGDEMMIMAGRESTVFTLNETATVLWEAADGVRPLEEIVEQQICGRFDVARADAIRDAEELVQALADHGILLLSDRPIGGPAAAPLRETT